MGETSTALPNGDDPSCDIYREWRKRSKGFLIRGYEGIPQNLILNCIGLVIMVFVFSFLRKKAWNYGRIALLNDVGWTTLFYRNSADKIRNKPASHPKPKNALDDSGYFDWIKITYVLTDAQLLAKSGPDAVQYLSYQRHLIFLAAVITCASLIIVLPVNLQGAREPNVKPDFSVFEQSTIFNLGSDSRLLWIHELLAISFLFLSIFVMRHFSRGLKFVQDDTLTLRTVIVAGVAKRYCSESRIRSHFMESHPRCEIEEFNLAYDVSKLVELEDQKSGVVSSRKYWEEYILLNGARKRPIMRPYTCGNICCCCCCVMKTTDALAYYTHLEYRLRKQSELERKRSYAKPLGVAFITFSTREVAEKVVNEYRLTARILMQTPVTKYSRRLKARNWVVSFAPLPEDLYWQHLSLGYRAWYFRAFVVNLTLVIIVLFYSTPVFLLNALNVYLEIQKITGLPGNSTFTTENSTSPETASSTIEGVLRDTVPTFLLWLAAVTLPSLVSLSDRFIGFWTKTSENRSKMIKTFTFLLFMVIILPSLGLTSASSFFLQDKPPQWKCIFSPSNGSFFVNYVITSCFLGTMSELMRIPELLVYSFKICFAKSAADIGAIRKSVLWDFQLGSQYAWMMLIFAIFILFSLITPIITIFGFIYLIFKHYVDRYNIYFAYAPCKVDKAVHGTAINFVVVCTFLQQLILVAYTNSDAHPIEAEPPHKPNSLNKPLQAFTILGFCVTATLFIGQVFFNLCTNFSPISYNRVPKDEETADEGQPESSPTKSEVVVYAPKSLSDFFGGDSPLQAIAGGSRSEESPTGTMQSTSSAQGNAAATEPEPQALISHGSPTLSSATESLDGRLVQIEQLEPEQLYRPGIDKPYGLYFPTVLRLDYDEESAAKFNNIYFKIPVEPADKYKTYTANYARNSTVFETHNGRNWDSSMSVAIIPGDEDEDSDSSDDSSDSSRSSRSRVKVTKIIVDVEQSDENFNHHKLPKDQQLFLAKETKVGDKIHITGKTKIDPKSTNTNPIKKNHH